MGLGSRVTLDGDGAPRVLDALLSAACARSRAPARRPAASVCVYLYRNTAFGFPYSPATQISEGLTQRYTFQGREASAHAGAGAPMYYRNRMYAANLGRFSRRDPKSDGDPLYNAYAAMGGSAVARTDPMGMTWSITGTISLDASVLDTQAKRPASEPSNTPWKPSPKITDLGALDIPALKSKVELTDAIHAVSSLSIISASYRNRYTISAKAFAQVAVAEDKGAGKSCVPEGTCPCVQEKITLKFKELAAGTYDMEPGSSIYRTRGRLIFAPFPNLPSSAEGTFNTCSDSRPGRRVLAKASVAFLPSTVKKDWGEIPATGGLYLNIEFEPGEISVQVLDDYLPSEKTRAEDKAEVERMRSQGERELWMEAWRNSRGGGKAYYGEKLKAGMRYPTLDPYTKSSVEWVQE